MVRTHNRWTVAITRHVLAGAAPISMAIAIAASTPSLAASTTVTTGTTDSAAQSIEAPGTDGDIVVTATRQSTKLQKTPVAVTVIGSQQIAQQNIVTARDLAGQIPGAFVQRSGITPLTQTFFIRGIGNSDPIFDPNVAQYVDDIYLPRAINGMTDLTDIERVEVLRGPQGTLFGENSDAGAIRYITKTPTDQTRADFDFGYGNYNTVNAHGYVAGALIPGLLDGSFAVAHDQHDGYTYDPTIDKHVNDQQTTGGRAKLLATPAPGLRILLTGDGTLDRSASAYYTPKQPIIGGTLQHPIYGPFDASKSYASQRPKNHSWSGGVSLKASYDIMPALTVSSISSYRGFAQDPVNYNNDGQPLVPYSTANPTPVSISDNYIVYKEHTVSQEFQLQGKFDKFDFASGLYYLYENFSSNRIGYVVSPTAASAAPAFPEDQIGDTKTTNYAAYAQGNYHFDDRLTATLGGRYTIEHRDFDFAGIYDDFSGNPLPVTPGAPTSTPGGFAAANNFAYQGKKTWRSFTPKLGLSYQLAEGVFGYASASRGFGAGGFNNRASSLATALPYGQEKVTTYEAGLKTDWFDHKLRFNATLFYNDYKDMQQTAAVISPITNGFVTVRSNANKAHTEGVELESSLEPIKDLVFTANASYLRAKFDSFPNAGVTGIGGKSTIVGASGNHLPFSPNWQLFGAVSYILPLDIPGHVRVGSDITYETAYYSDVFNYVQGKVPSQAFVDTSISYAAANGHWNFSLTGRNLADHRSYQAITWGGTPNLWEGPVSPPRTVFFKVAYSL